MFLKELGFYRLSPRVSEQRERGVLQSAAKFTRIDVEKHYPDIVTLVRHGPELCN